MTARAKPDTIEVERVARNVGYRARGGSLLRIRRRAPSQGYAWLAFAVIWFAFMTPFSYATWALPGHGGVCFASFDVVFLLVGALQVYLGVGALVNTLRVEVDAYCLSSSERPLPRRRGVRVERAAVRDVAAGWVIDIDSRTPAGFHVLVRCDGSSVRLTPDLLEDEARFIAETLREHLGLPT